jgi:hypothetical protein
MKNCLRSALLMIFLAVAYPALVAAQNASTPAPTSGTDPETLLQQLRECGENIKISKLYVPLLETRSGAELEVLKWRCSRINAKRSLARLRENIGPRENADAALRIDDAAQNLEDLEPDVTLSFKSFGLTDAEIEFVDMTASFAEAGKLDELLARQARSAPAATAPPKQSGGQAKRDWKP